MSYEEFLFFKISSRSSSSSTLSLLSLLLQSMSFSVFLWNNYNLLSSFIRDLNMHFSLVLNETLISYEKWFLQIRWKCTDLHTSTLFWFSLVNKSLSWLVHSVHDQMIFDLSRSVASSQSTLRKSASIANDKIMQHNAIFLRLKMTKARMNEMKIVILAHSREKMIVRSKEDWESSSWESEDCWEWKMSSISLCWINDMYETHFFFCLWAFVFSAHLEVQSCILSCYKHAWINQSSDLTLINLIRTSHDAMFSLNLAHFFKSFSALLFIVQHFLHSSFSSFF